MKKNSFSLRKTIGIGFSLLFLLSLISATKWANYRESFLLTKVKISGYNILDEKDYQKIISEFNKPSLEHTNKKKTQSLEKNKAKSKKISKK